MHTYSAVSGAISGQIILGNCNLSLLFHTTALAQGLLPVLRNVHFVLLQGNHYANTV